MWKTKFTAALKKHIEREIGIKYDTDQQIYEGIISLQDRRGLWGQIADILDILPQQAHDYYHNTWSKQFFVQFDEFKPYLTEQITQHINDDSTKKEIITNILNEFLASKPDIKFHRMSVSQYINHQFEKIIKNQGNNSKMLEGNSACTISTFSDTKNESELITKFLIFGNNSKNNDNNELPNFK
ncbi:Conserved_hypothetical protein [Hexamita inflata]|uniref:Uncharacterized protein n=1 Tax=Hexamita inflata TaxID=28002 RepID=A0ABP1GPK5_9EUKA